MLELEIINKKDKALKQMIEMCEHFAPTLSEGHICGPESNCDCDCMEIHHINECIQKAKKALSLKL